MGLELGFVITYGVINLDDFNGGDYYLEGCFVCYGGVCWLTKSILDWSISSDGVNGVGIPSLRYCFSYP